MHYNFEWDPIKAKQNIKKHKVNFERATQVFLDPFAISIFDVDHSLNEDRWITMAKDRNEVLLVVAHTFFEETSTQVNIRIISVRRAIKREIKEYEGYHL